MDSLYGLTKYKKNESDNSHILIDHFTRGFTSGGAIISKIVNHRHIDFRIKLDIPDIFPYEVEEIDGCYYGLALGADPYREYIFVVKPTVSTEEIVLDLPLKIYPNPFDNNFEIELPDNMASPFDITIVDTNGKPILYQYSRERNNAIEMNGFPSGLYFITVTDANHQNYKGKIIKQ